VIVSGNIDLSVGSAVYFLAVVASWCQVMWDWPAIPTLLVVMVIAVVIGAFHGFWVSRLRVPAMIVTLGSMLFLRGFGLLITKGLQIQGMDDIFRVISDGALSLPWTLVVVGVSYLSYLAVVLRRRRAAQRNGRAGRQNTEPWIRAAGVLVAAAVVTLVFSGERGFPVALLFLAIMSMIVQFLIRDTRFGRYVYAIGGNRDAAAMSGIPVARYTFLVFVLMGAMYGLGSWYLTARLNGSSAVTGLMLESDVIAACVIGGASLSGGSGTLMGAVLGAVLMESLRNGMTLLGLVYNWQYISKGIILLVAAWIDIASRSKSADMVGS
jgi:D-xylose transport system permease protein